MINLNPDINSILAKTNLNSINKSSFAKAGNDNNGFSDTVKAVQKYISNADKLQKTSDISVQDLLSGKNDDITSVVSAVSKADMSFKLLVGVRNKLIEAYKQTMNMPI